MWKTFGFSSNVASQGAGSFQVNKKPFTTDYINWRLPTQIPIVKGSLVVIVNGLATDNGTEVLESDDGLGFYWNTPNPLTPADSVWCMYAI